MVLSLWVLLLPQFPMILSCNIRSRPFTSFPGRECAASREGQKMWWKVSQLRLHPKYKFCLCAYCSTLLPKLMPPEMTGVQLKVQKRSAHPTKPEGYSPIPLQMWFCRLCMTSRYHNSMPGVCKGHLCCTLANAWGSGMLMMSCCMTTYKRRKARSGARPSLGLI